MTTVDDRGLDPSDAQRGAPKRAPADASPGTGVNRWKWQNVYVKRLYLTDAITVVLSVILAQTVRFGYEDLLLAGGGGQLDYTVVSAVLIVAWLGALSLFRSRSRRVIGAGYDEYQRVISATLAMFGTIAIIALITNQQIARGFLAIALPVGLAGLLLSRWVWRKVVARKRARGEFQTSVTAVTLGVNVGVGSLC